MLFNNTDSTMKVAFLRFVHHSNSFKDNNYEQTKHIRILTLARLKVDKAAVWANTCKAQLCQLFIVLY